MPKIVDRTQRRDEVAAALWRLAFREGWDAVSMRRVADEAGLSLGSLQHYFTGLDDLLDFSVSGLLDILDERLVEQLTTLTDPRDAESTVRKVLQSMIPGATVDPTAGPQPADNWRIQVMAWLAVVNRAARNPEMSARLSAGSNRLAAAIATLVHSNTSRTHDDALRDAHGLLGLVEGLLLRLARRDTDPGEAATVVARFVGLTFQR